MDRRRQLEEIYDAHATALHGFLLNLLRDADLSREVLQEVFRKLTGRPQLIAAVRDERAFLLRLAHNQAIDLIRKRSSTDQRKQAFADERANPFAPAQDPDEAAFRLALSEALVQLPAEQRAVVHLKLWEGMTFDAIATTLDIPPNTAASRYRVYSVGLDFTDDDGCIDKDFASKKGDWVWCYTPEFIDSAE
jgi:RNA polymerase sigma-70 factor (ECF subfamily)